MNQMQKMFVVPFLPVVFLYSQVGIGIPEESRSPMSIRTQISDNCKLAISGQAWVGRQTIKGGIIQVRDLSGSGIKAVSGVLRIQFANGRYQDQVWRHETLGFPALTIKIPPEEMQFSSGLVLPTRIDGKVLGVYFANGETCGETGHAVKERFTRTIEELRKDADEVMAIANAVPAKVFLERVRSGVLVEGPYARASAGPSNAMLRGNLISTDGKLVLEYKDWIKRWQDSLRPARPVRPTRSSQLPGQ